MLHRRACLALIAFGLASPVLAQGPAMSRITAFTLSFAGLAGGDIKLADHAGKPILVVNTASQCGYTPQYTGLEDLWKRYEKRGLLIVGVPSNDFGGQEPGNAKDIQHFVSHDYGITFPIAAKAAVKGANQHPFYKWAAGERPNDMPKWNFHKFLIGRDGHIVASFPSAVEPTDPKVIAAIEGELR